MTLRVAPMSPGEIAAAIDALADLRIRVFAEFPYLYAGDRDYERAYLRPYLESAGAIVVGAWDGPTLVGAATGTPLEDHAEDFAAVFAGRGIALDTVFYFGESLLLPEYRGRGIGHRFFDLREVHARARGRRSAAFCAVIRPEDHPLRPPGYRPLDGFWRRRGYAPLPGAVVRFPWREHGEAAASAKAMQVWMRQLGEETP